MDARANRHSSRGGLHDAWLSQPERLSRVDSKHASGVGVLHERPATIFGRGNPASFAPTDETLEAIANYPRPPETHRRMLSDSTTETVNKSFLLDRLNADREFRPLCVG